LALIKTSPRLPECPPAVNALPTPTAPGKIAPPPENGAYLCTEGKTMKHSSSALTKPSIESYLY